MQLTQKIERWHWNKKQEKAFSALKRSLSKTVHLVIFQAAYEKVLKTDTLNFAVNACLYQIKDRFRRSVVFQSRKLSEFKKKYKIHDKELLVIVKALQEWRSYFTDTAKFI